MKHFVGVSIFIRDFESHRQGSHRQPLAVLRQVACRPSGLEGRGAHPSSTQEGGALGRCLVNPLPHGRQRGWPVSGCEDVRRAWPLLDHFPLLFSLFKNETEGHLALLSKEKPPKSKKRETDCPLSFWAVVTRCDLLFQFLVSFYRLINDVLLWAGPAKSYSFGSILPDGASGCRVAPPCATSSLPFREKNEDIELWPLVLALVCASSLLGRAGLLVEIRCLPYFIQFFVCILSFRILEGRRVFGAPDPLVAFGVGEMPGPVLRSLSLFLFKPRTFAPVQRLSKDGPGPVASAAPGSLLGMQTLRFTPRPLDQKLCIETSLPGDPDAC